MYKYNAWCTIFNKLWGVWKCGKHCLNCLTYNPYDRKGETKSWNIYLNKLSKLRRYLINNLWVRNLKNFHNLHNYSPVTDWLLENFESLFSPLLRSPWNREPHAFLFFLGPFVSSVTAQSGCPQFKMWAKTNVHPLKATCKLLHILYLANSLLVWYIMHACMFIKIA